VSKEQIVVGGGLVGPLLAIILKKAGHNVELYERRPDIRLQNNDSGRSINLVVTSRGIHALKQVGLDSEILKDTVPVMGRMMHSTVGELTYQAYGKDDSECNYSISRLHLNKVLLTKAEELGIPIHFSHQLENLEIKNNECNFTTPNGNKKVSAENIFGTDGSGSRVRAALCKDAEAQKTTYNRLEPLGVAYKELLIPAGDNNSYPMEKNALHIWPRGNHMLMALPNLDGSFVVTLYLPIQGEISFSNLESESQINSFFNKYYADSIPLMPKFIKDFLNNPVGNLATVKCFPWVKEDKVILVGDAAHGIVPFFGQGMNSGFEDCAVLFDLLNLHGNDWGRIFQEFQSIQKENGDAIADMAIENYVEMSEKVGQKDFLLKKQIEAILTKEFPSLYKSRYNLVTHDLIPYKKAQDIGHIQSGILEELVIGIESVDETDLVKAKILLNERLSPYLQTHSISFLLV
jgi:kynurenine 3-monooxygenase